MLKRQAIAIALLAATVTLAHAQDAPKQDPKTGKNCVTYLSSELSPTGQVRMNFRNICGSPFQIQVKAGENQREKTIDAGSPESPSKAYVSCKQDEGCESAKWQYE